VVSRAHPTSFSFQRAQFYLGNARSRFVQGHLHDIGMQYDAEISCRDESATVTLSEIRGATEALEAMGAVVGAGEPGQHGR